MNRTTISLIAAVVAVAGVYGVATAAAPPPPSAPAPLPASAERQPVQRTTLMCPAPTGTEFDSSVYTAYTPPALYGGGPTGGTASLTPILQTDGSVNTKPSAHAKPVTPLTAPGKPVVTAGGTNTYPVVGSADGALAPGWSADMTTSIDAGTGVGLLGTACGQAGTDFWIPGASLASSRQDWIHLTNPDPRTATVDIDMYDANGAVKATDNTGITVPGDASMQIMLSSLAPGSTAGDVTLDVQARTGRVAADLQAMSKTTGSDWITPSADPADTAVLPGIPKDATAVRLIGYATTANDAAVKLQLLTPDGAITPYGHETVDFKNGVTTAVNLPKLTQGQVGSLVLSPVDPTQAAPFVAAVQVVRGRGSDQEMAFISATGPVGARSTVADNRAGDTSLAIASPDGDATVKVIASQPSKGGKGASTTVTVKKGTTLQVTVPKPSGSGTYALTVVPVSGPPVYACRELAITADNGLAAFTLQTMPDDGGYVAVPRAAQDLTVATQ